MCYNIVILLLIQRTGTCAILWQHKKRGEKWELILIRETKVLRKL